MGVSSGLRRYKSRQTRSSGVSAKSTLEEAVSYYIRSYVVKIYRNEDILLQRGQRSSSGRQEVGRRNDGRHKAEERGQGVGEKDEFYTKEVGLSL